MNDYPHGRKLPLLPETLFRMKQFVFHRSYLTYRLMINRKVADHRHALSPNTAVREGTSQTGMLDILCAVVFYVVQVHFVSEKIEVCHNTNTNLTMKCLKGSAFSSICAVVSPSGLGYCNFAVVSHKSATKTGKTQAPLKGGGGQLTTDWMRVDLTGLNFG